MRIIANHWAGVIAGRGAKHLAQCVQAHIYHRNTRLGQSDIGLSCLRLASTPVTQRPNRSRQGSQPHHHFRQLVRELGDAL
ncbi:hypothetical protein BGP84_27145 [Pseudomonas putida]|uniref:Uncharacterized protein n=1 Tax=Pseudomonas putida TaxID=303 RepID=A0A2S3WZQ5_PSEPU|nr:hypothetical protein BGP84_27145 [Pseudomonas putida]POG09236.1 hypothetical protein BGP85_21220 [Pseudomonas putida]